MAGKNIAFIAKVNKDLPYLSHILSDLGDLIGYDYNGVTTILPASGVDNGLTASTSSDQAGALALNYRNSRVTTSAVAGDSVVLPFALKGMSMIVCNAAAANAIDVFPATGDAINALSANTALSISANASAQFTCMVNGTWNTIV